MSKPHNALARPNKRIRKIKEQIKKNRERLRRHRRKLLISFVLLAAIVTLLSSTIGRELLAGKDPSLWSFAFIHFGGYLFFLLLPVEALIPFYLAQGHNALLLFVLAIFTAGLAQLIDYGIGYLVSDHVIGRVVKGRKIDRAKKYINSYGDLIILLFNATPLSSPILLLVAGMVRYPFWRTMMYSVLGQLIKYTVLFIVVLFVL